MEATLLKNRSSNTFISKHCRIVLRQIKHSSNSNTKARQSSVGSIKFDMVGYIDRVPIEERLAFTKCALDSVFIHCTISAQEIDSGYDDNLSVASANTVRVDSFWLDIDEQKSPSPILPNHNTHIINGNGNANGNANGYINGNEGISDNEEQEGQNKLRLTDKHLAKLGDGKQKDMAKFRIKHAMDVMANENS